MSKTQQTAGEKPRIGEQEVRRAAELLKKYRQGKVNLERRIIDNEQFWIILYSSFCNIGKQADL